MFLALKEIVGRFFIKFRNGTKYFQVSGCFMGTFISIFMQFRSKLSDFINKTSEFSKLSFQVFEAKLYKAFEHKCLNHCVYSRLFHFLYNLSSLSVSPKLQC